MSASSVVIRAIGAFRHSTLGRPDIPMRRLHTNRLLIPAVASPTSWPTVHTYHLHYNHRFIHTIPTQNYPYLKNILPVSQASTSASDTCNSTDGIPLLLRQSPAGSEGYSPISRSIHSRSSPLSPPLATHRKPRRRVVYTGRLHSGIEKRRTLVPSRHFTTPSSSKSPATRPADPSDSPSTTSASVKTSTSVTWREALESPRKAITYAGQVRRDLFDWAKHMWAGTKLLAADVRVSYKILKRITSGKHLTRRERNFIVQTGVDLARLVPFSLFLIIPLAEFALPFALRLFPNMLPSQFQNQMKSEENLKRRLKARLGLAKYLQEVVEEKAKLVKASDVNSELKKNAEDLTEFLHAIRNGKDVTGSSISRFAKFFNDELTIDGAGRPQLVAMCKYMGLSPYGHDMFLRFKLRSRLNAIKRDDMQIMWEGGVDSLTDSEVAKACRDRGIREEVSNKWMRKQMGDWLDLSQRREIPGSLLIMSRALLYGRTDEMAEHSEDVLAETLGSMPEDVMMDVKQAADVGDGTNVERLEETLRQAKLIELESERVARKEKEDNEKRKKKEGEEDVKEGTAEDLISDKEVLQKVEAHEAEVKKDMFNTDNMNARADAVGGAGEAVVADGGSDVESMDEEEVLMERDRIRDMLVSLGELSSDSSVQKEREELGNLRLQLVEAEVLVKGTDGESSADMRRFKKMVTKLGREIERVDAKVGLRMKMLDKDNDGVMSLEELRHAMTVIAGERDEDVVAEMLQRLDADADGNISKGDLTRVLHELQFEHGVVGAEGTKQTDDATPVSSNGNGKDSGAAATSSAIGGR